MWSDGVGQGVVGLVGGSSLSLMCEERRSDGVKGSGGCVAGKDRHGVLEFDPAPRSRCRRAACTSLSKSSMRPATPSSLLRLHDQASVTRSASAFAALQRPRMGPQASSQIQSAGVGADVGLPAY